MPAIWRQLLLLLFVGLGCNACAFGQTNDKSLSDAAKLFGLSYFWKEVGYNFAFFDQVPELNWDSAYQAYIPRVLATESTYDYYRELERFCALLKDGHTSIYMPRWLRDSISYPKLLLAEIDHRVYVRNVDSGLAKDIPIGSEIVAINGMAAAEYVQSEVMPYQSVSAEHVLWNQSVRRALKGRKGTAVRVVVQPPDGEQVTFDLMRDRSNTKWIREIPERPLLVFEWKGDGIAYFQLNSFNDTAIVSQFEAVLPDLYDAKGVIIDLRNNTGGNTRNGTDILQHFTGDTLWGSTWKTPMNIAAYKAWGKHHNDRDEDSEMRQHYLGNAWHTGDDWYITPDDSRKVEAPVVVLFGRITASAAEDFLIFADEIDRFLYVGEPTNGSTGQPLFIEDLPGGGTARICTKRDTYPDGRDFVGYGIQPDVHVIGTLQSLIDESDPVLDKGLEELMARMSEH
jgi:C-terminal processing protease CtpA/Prc